VPTRLVTRFAVHVTMRSLSIPCMVLAVALVGSHASAQSMTEFEFEFDGTVRGMSSGFITVRDVHCRMHGLAVSGEPAVWNGHVFQLYDPSYLNKNVHVVARRDRGLEILVSAQTQKGPSAPRNCTTYSPLRTLEGVLTAYSMGSSLGSISVKLDTGDTTTFVFSDSDTRARFFGNRITGGLPADVHLGRTRIVVTYHVASDVNGNRAEIVAVRRAGPL